jgi:uridine phosphorylase
MTVPRFAGKHEHGDLVSPAAMRAWRAERGMVPDCTPEAVVMLYQDALYEAVRAFEETTVVGEHGAYQRTVSLDRTGGRVGVVGAFGYGAPMAAMVMEDLAVLGTTRFVSMGTAGSLQPDLPPGGVVVCTGAVRDEGVSHHYAPADEEALPDGELTDALERALDDAELAPRRGSTWTIDTPYRETVAEALHYRDAGVLCVEMEAAALFTVAAHRGVAVAAAFCMSDTIIEGEWDGHFDNPLLAHNLLTLYGAAVDALAAPR